MRFLRKIFNNTKLGTPAKEAAEQLSFQKPQVHAVVSWLESRANQNGFGEDFEYTLKPRGAKW
jgi:hypothetical protein